MYCKMLDLLITILTTFLTILQHTYNFKKKLTLLITILTISFLENITAYLELKKII